jgi:L-amino acid N-acyltransferase YncA
VPVGANILAGSLNALLRPEFAAERDPALDRRQAPPENARILVTMGTTDPGGISEKIVDAALDASPGCVVDIVIGSQAAGEQGRARDRVSVHVDSQHMARLMRDADIAIGAAGATSWERCCLGLPSIAFILAENQRAGALALAETGAAIAIEQVAEVGPELGALLADAPRFARMSAAAAAIVDGNGTRRVVQAMLGERSTTGDISLRPARPEDSRLLWLWRNDPQTRKQSRSHDPVAWNDHAAWFERALNDPSRSLLIAESEGQPFGMVRFDDGDAGSEVSINVAPDQRGSAIGGAILAAACAQHHARPLIASVQQENVASRRVFKACGFHQVESSEPGFLRYELPVEQLRRGQA